MHLPGNTALNGQRTRSFCLILTILAGAFLCAALLFSPGSRAATTGNQVPPAPPASNASAGPDQRQNIAHAFGKLPLSFAANVGQADSRVRFIARGPGYNVFLTGDEAVLVLRGETRGAAERNAEGETASSSSDDIQRVQSIQSVQVVRLKLDGANRKAKIDGHDELPGKLNYLIGNNANKWRTNVFTRE